MKLVGLTHCGQIESRLRSSESKSLRVAELIEYFMNSSSVCMAEVYRWESDYSNINSARDAFSQAIKRAELSDQVMCCQLKGVLYLIKI